jgi:hypothetical protein
MLTELIQGYEKGKIAIPYLIWLTQNNLPLEYYLPRIFSFMNKTDESRESITEENRRYLQNIIFKTGVVSAALSLYAKDRFARVFMPKKRYKKISLWNKANPFKPELN